MLHIPWTARRTNESVLQELDVSRKLLKSVMERKLSYFGHVMRRSGECLEKMIMQGCIEGRLPRGRPARTWIDDIMETTGCSLSHLIRKTEKRDDWRELVHSASNHQN
jgi:hypothetical protein